MTRRPPAPLPDPSAMPDPDLAAALARLHARAFRFPRPWSTEEFAALLEDPSCVLALHPGEQAFALFRLAGPEAELLTIATDPDHRRKGLARSALGTGLELAVRRGAQECFLEVAADNSAAISLYEGFGFRVAGRRPGYYTAPDGARTDAILMALALQMF